MCLEVNIFSSNYRAIKYLMQEILMESSTRSKLRAVSEKQQHVYRHLCAGWTWKKNSWLRRHRFMGNCRSRAAAVVHRVQRAGKPHKYVFLAKWVHLVFVQMIDTGNLCYSWSFITQDWMRGCSNTCAHQLQEYMMPLFVTLILTILGQGILKVCTVTNKIENTGSTLTP